MPKQYGFTCLFLNFYDWGHIVLFCVFELTVNLYISIDNFYCCLLYSIV